MWRHPKLYYFLLLRDQWNVENQISTIPLVCTCHSFAMHEACLYARQAFALHISL
jgi:hypothetical protein